MEFREKKWAKGENLKFGGGGGAYTVEGNDGICIGQHSAWDLNPGYSGPKVGGVIVTSSAFGKERLPQRPCYRSKVELNITFHSFFL